MMAALSELIAAGLIEKDSHGEVLWTWSYPAVTLEQRQLLLSKCCLASEKSDIIPLMYSQFNRTWYYVYTTAVNSPVLPKVTHVSLVLLAKDFNPEKYRTLGEILGKVYTKTGNPASMLERYLSVTTKGTCSGEENGMFAVSEYDIRQAYVASSIKDVIKHFGIEAILIYTALMLKKRIAVYHSRTIELLDTIRAFPTLVWHRQNWNILFPMVDLDSKDVDTLKTLSNYVAGFTSAAIESRTDLYDVFVSLSTGEITVAPHAKESMTMSKLHKDIALYMVQCAEDEEKTDQQVIKDIAMKTKELLNNLRSLAIAGDDGKSVITLEVLQKRKMPAASENFLFSLAAAEGLVKI